MNETENITPIKLGGILIEITRRCNLKCVHCVRGEAQNKTLSREVIDALLDNVTFIDRIDLTGGEPLLEIEIIDYLVNQINSRGIIVSFISFVTNGTILDARIISILQTFIDGDDDRVAIINISADSFHDKQTIDNALSFYKKAAEGHKNINVMLNHDAEDLGTYNQARNEHTPIYLDGNAKNLSKEMLQDKLTAQAIEYLNHRIRIYNNYVECALYLACDGGITLEDMCSYKTTDNNIIGNILNESLLEIIKRFNQNCVYNCHDLVLYELFQNINTYIAISQLKDNTSLNPYLIFVLKATAQIGLKIIPNVFHAREEAHKLYPFVPMSEILKTLPIPPFSFTYDFVIDDILDGKIYNRLPDSCIFLGNELFNSITEALKYIRHQERLDETIKYDNEMTVNNITAALCLVNLSSLGYAHAKYWGSIARLQDTPEFIKLAQLNEDYKTGTIEFNNDEIMPCQAVTTIAELVNKRVQENAERALKNIFAKNRNNVYCNFNCLTNLITLNI